MVQWPRLLAPNAGGLGLIPGQGIRSYMPQLKIPSAATNTWPSQIDVCFKFHYFSHFWCGSNVHSIIGEALSFNMYIYAKSQKLINISPIPYWNFAVLITSVQPTLN